ncbi:hypothetical protein [Paenibacillus roseipurpureus]|uniref:Uncharacterized protein n=1 Tax=Paenibacillus roseopurpureus TaxID=2918901 RepID=A0AA96LS22_9BACL|nr:hypothetical protein [Paenibacillus sp. MBLB1832]WNR44863.1 hypothetical protein MJB10_01550 [Paenibacillus sp. MBLB1832]
MSLNLDLKTMLLTLVIRQLFTAVFIMPIGVSIRAILQSDTFSLQNVCKPRHG